MIGVNRVILIGNLGRDPELRRTPNGSSVVSFTLATTERWTDKNGQRQEKTEWHNIVAWGKLAEIANQYLKKGRTAYIDGRISSRSWDDRDGNKRQRTEIIANQIQFLGGGGASQGAGPTEISVEEPNDAPNNFAEPISEDDLPF